MAPCERSTIAMAVTAGFKFICPDVTFRAAIEIELPSALLSIVFGDHLRGSLTHRHDTERENFATQGAITPSPTNRISTI
jgi:hypothetical protein